MTPRRLRKFRSNAGRYRTLAVTDVTHHLSRADHLALMAFLGDDQ